MASRKFAFVFLCIFLVGALPLVMAQSYGIEIAALSAGFMASLENPATIALFVACGIVSVLCGITAAIAMPLSTLLLFLIGAGMKAGDGQFEYLKPLMLTWLLLFAATTHILHNRRFIVFALAFGVTGFAFGSDFAALQLDSVDTGPYFIGGAISALLLCGTGVCIGVTLTERLNSTAEKLKATSATTFLSWFF